MAIYRVTFALDASVSIKVQADSPEEAEATACEEIGMPSICHQCSNEIEIGDVGDTLEVEKVG